jgi:hypothetical protein
MVYLQRAKMPTPERWATAIRDAGFPVDLEHDFDPYSAFGSRPGKFRGEPSGFEYYIETLGEEDAEDLELPPECDFAVNLVTHSDLREYATSLIAASVLAAMTGGVLSDPETEEAQPASGVLAWARRELASFEHKL